MYEKDKIYAIEFDQKSAEIRVYRILDNIWLIPSSQEVLKCEYLGDIFEMCGNMVFQENHDVDKTAFIEKRKIDRAYELSEHKEVIGYSFDSTWIDCGAGDQDLAINGPKWLTTDYVKVRN